MCFQSMCGKDWLNNVKICKAGDLLAIRGRLEGKCKMEGKEEEYLSRIIAEKITFLTIKGKENGFVY